MKTNLRNAEHGTQKAKRQRAFTMIEIAISLAVIAFALVAIIGVLPTGLNVQKDNREDTIINQDGPYWLEAIRTGARGLDYLTNYVDTITVKRVGTFNGTAVDTFVIFTNSPNPLPSAPYDGTMTNGERIIGLLSRPRYEGDPTNPTNRITNSIAAKVRGLSGSAVEQGLANRDFSFDYLLTPEIVPFQFFAFNSTNYLAYPSNSPAWIVRSNRFVQALNIGPNTSEIRLTFRWPLLPNDETGPGRQNFRAIASGVQTNTGIFYFFQPGIFKKP